MRGRSEETTSRADQVRRQHQQQSQARINSTRQRAASSASAPKAPISGRTYSNAAMGHSPAVGTTPRRKVVYAAGANGAEVRLPSIPIIHFDWKMVSGALTIALIIVVFLLPNLPAFQINSVEVKGIQRIPQGDITAILRANASSIFTLDSAKAVKAITASFPELKNVQIQNSLTGGVTVQAVERQPILAWTSGDQTLWIDKEGVVMPVRGEAANLVTIQSSVIPPLTHPIDTTAGVLDYARLALANQALASTQEMVIPQMDPNVLNAAIELTSKLPQGASLVYDPVNGMGWVDPRGWRVYFGIDLSELSVKEAEYQTIIDKLSQEGVTPVMISVEFLNAPYYRTE
jgi:hypothetical protein